MSILDEYVKTAPGPQNALDIFKGEWSSRLPGDLASLRAGSIPLFEDSRIEWGVNAVGGVKDKDVLELGPLEAGHTYMLERSGARTITSIEANTRAYLKCLIVKEILELKRAHFLCGDFVEYLRTNTRSYDIGIASGVLYHMQNPAELIALLAKACNNLLIWTHYFDSAVVSSKPSLANKFTKSAAAVHAGFRYTQFRHEYGDALKWFGFCGGSMPYSHWMSRDDILSCLRFFGFHHIRTSFEMPDHPNGPSFAILATKRSQ